MTPDKSMPNLQQKEAIAPSRFDPRSATPFVNKSVSEETRRAYRRAVANFFQFVEGKHPIEVGSVARIISERRKLQAAFPQAAIPNSAATNFAFPCPSLPANLLT
jgi:hypothetical protein